MKQVLYLSLMPQSERPERSTASPERSVAESKGRRVQSKDATLRGAAPHPSTTRPEQHGHSALGCSALVEWQHATLILCSSFGPRRDYLLTTVIIFGLTVSAFGMLKVNSPCSYLASALSASTGMLMLSVRWNRP